MEKSEVEKSMAAEDGNHLNRNRSFKSKQLVRSQAIRESTSPPRTASPSVRSDDSQHANTRVSVDATVDNDSSQDGDVFNCSGEKKQSVEIQITQGSWDTDAPCDQRGRTKRWLCDTSHDLLSNNPRITCVCGSCAACPHCRGKRRRNKCPTKQDSGIVCSVDCPDCSDTEHNGSLKENGNRKAGSVDVDDQYYCRCADRKDKPKSISLSRTDSDDKSEPLGPDLVTFIKETLNKNARDRATLLKIEKELHCFVNDTGRCIVKFPVMTSYGRMLVHRCAALFQLAHHLDQSNKTCVIVSKNGTCGGRIPCTSFKSWCVTSLPPSPQRQPTYNDPTHAKSILKRDTHSLDEGGGGATSMSRSKSLEQREREYARVRRRIFSTDNCPHDEAQWPWVNSGPVKLLTPEAGRNKLLKVQSLESSTGPGGGGSRAGGAVSKSHSFGGYGDQQQPRALSRQGDLASSSWRLSPSSSGYKTLSLRSTDSVTPSPTGGGTPEPSSNANPSHAGNPAGGALVWAVTDLSAVPAGALVIHPQTGRPLTNPDGSVYHFDPANPPVLYDPSVYADTDGDNKIDQNSEKRRGRLEKQHSFIDSAEADCQASEDCRNKCCCECQRQTDQGQTTSQPTEKEQPKPTSPIKTHYNRPPPNHAEPTNDKPPPEISTNQKSPEITQPDATANQRQFENQIQNRSYELANHREVKVGQEMVHYNQNYQGYNTEEVQVTSPPQMNPYIHQDMSNMQNHMQHAKVAPMHIQDPNIRPISLTNMMYPAMQPAYPAYIQNQCRMEPMQQQMYQGMLQQQIDEHKQISTSPQTHENTFRIDPSYPYAAMDYSACGVEPQPMHAPPQRSYSVPYNPVEVPAVPHMLPSAYQVPNILLPPQMPQYPVQYQEPVQWTQMPPANVAPKLYDMCPLVYPHHYTHYKVVYPQMLPQHYPMCTPMYPVMEKQPSPPRSVPRKRNSLPTSTRNTPLPVEEKKEELNRQNSTEIAAKIQQIKDQMAQLNTRGRDRDARREGEWRRNSGNGILGSYPANPANNYNVRQYNGRPANDDAQLSTAARAIVNSIRNMQAKHTYHQEKRTYETQTYQRSYNRRDREQDRQPGDRPPGDRQDTAGEGDRKDPRSRGANTQHAPCRPPYLLRQMSPGTWCRRSPAPVHPAINHPRRPHPDARNGRR